MGKEFLMPHIVLEMLQIENKNNYNMQLTGHEVTLSRTLGKGVMILA